MYFKKKQKIDRHNCFGKGLLTCHKLRVAAPRNCEELCNHALAISGILLQLSN